LALFGALACDDGETATDEPPLCETLGDCTEVGDAPAFTSPVVVAPSTDLPPQVVSQPSHNNLDIVWHQGRLFFAFRTAPNHFASADTWLYVVSTTDQQTWRFEGAFHEGRDLREPRFLSLAGELHLFYALLGTDPRAFEPGGSQRVTWRAPGEWSLPVSVFPGDFIPWRIKAVDGVAYLLGYSGGAGVYTGGDDAVEVHWLRSEDGSNWTAVVPGQPVVHTGGVSETDFAFLPDGGIVAVGRNEAGQDGVFGSRICRAEASALGDWRCTDDPRKYDSPLVFSHGDQVWLIARRNVTGDGHYDLRKPLTPEQQWGVNQAAYWMQPKRCALWRVDPDALTVTHALDLPSSGDTCFPSAIPTGPGQFLVYNYSSDFAQPDLTWLQGQDGPTFIYRTTLTLP
jgi:hypothetical protein